MPFKKIGLCDELVQGILATGYTAPTEIQAEAIPIAIAGRDMIGCAQTGTGKTAAFVLPILNRISTRSKQKTDGSNKRPKRKVSALIITPTRELALQIDTAVKGYGRFTQVKSLAVFGGSSMEKQVKALRSGVDVIAATPGRLMDHMQRGTIDLSSVEVLVLDEADRMLDMGFINDIQKIIKKMPKDRQTLLFSATMSKEVTTLTRTIQRSPKMIQIGRQHNPIDTITQHIFPVPKAQKIELLLTMIEDQHMYSVLIFSRTKRGADRICRKLKQHDIKAEAIHSDRTQSQRQRAMEGFRRGKFKVMVATDIAARGINIEGISHVFNFDVPAFPEDYVHRIGRTGRAEATGDAITFVCSDEIEQIRKIERFIDRTFEAEYYEGFQYKLRIQLGRTHQGGGQSRRKRAGAAGAKKRTGGSSRGKFENKKRPDKQGPGNPSRPKRMRPPRKKTGASNQDGASDGNNAATSSKKSTRRKPMAHPVDKSGTGSSKKNAGRKPKANSAGKPAKPAFKRIKKKPGNSGKRKP
jgi:ATP-dependent RNA helicase RhlE